MGLAVRNPVLPGRSLDDEPFRADEERVRAHLIKLQPDLARTPDPIGALITWHDALWAEKQGRAVDVETALSRTDLPVPDRRPAILGDPTNQYRTARYSSARDHPLSTSAMGATRDP